ncbi:MAG TPA: hypothetical protein VFS21_28630 [Roseiflexaceae bacterium]|nr:hypothetical protein [Roseiflexaceae bacterium]
MIANAHESYAEQSERQELISRETQLKLALWGLWLLAVAAGGYLYWRGALEAQGSVDPVGLVVRMLLVGGVALLIKTLVELRFDPERFMD